jgi:hypothetical protein
MVFIKNLINGWKLYKSNIENSRLFFNSYKPNDELIESQNYVNTINDNSTFNAASAILKTNEIIYNNIKNSDKKWNFYDFLRKKSFDVYNILFIDESIVIFIINKENPTFVVQNFFYMEIYYIGYINDKLLIQINHSETRAELQLPVIEKYLLFITELSNDDNNLLYKQFIFFGFIGNVGHHLWNELSGLNIFLQQKSDIHEKIDGICIGKYDFFNMETFLKKNYNFKITKYENAYACPLRIFPIFLNSFILDKNIPELFNKIIEFDYIQKDLNALEIALDIRTCSRKLLNIFPLYVNIINAIYNRYNYKYKIKIYFLGRFSTHVNNINKNTDVEFIEQNTLVSNIIQQVNNDNIIFENLIGEYFSLSFKKVMNIDLNICIEGTSISNLMNWIYKKKTIGLSHTYYYKLVQDIQYNCLKNFNMILPPINYIKDTESDNFYVYGLKFIPFLLDILDSFGL